MPYGIKALRGIARGRGAALRYASSLGEGHWGAKAIRGLAGLSNTQLAMSAGAGIGAAYGAASDNTSIVGGALGGMAIGGGAMAALRYGAKAEWRYGRARALGASRMTATKAIFGKTMGRIVTPAGKGSSRVAQVQAKGAKVTRTGFIDRVKRAHQRMLDFMVGPGPGRR